MGRKTKFKCCYFCGKPATSREHVPPRMMFDGFDCGSITVPSCRSHNTNKQGHDQAITNLMLQSLMEGDKYRGDRFPAMDADVIKAIVKAEHEFDRTRQLAFLVPMTGEPILNLPPIKNIACLMPNAHYFPWIRQITAALVYSAIGYPDPPIDWQNVKAWSPTSVQSEYPHQVTYSEMVEQLYDLSQLEQPYLQMTWYSGWSANPPYPRTIYYFEVGFRNNRVVFRHVFYGQHKCYVEFTTTNQIHRKLKIKLLAH